MTKKTLLTTICLLIYTFFEILVVVMDVGLLALAFCTPVLIGFLLKPVLGETFSMLCLVVGVALFGIAFVYRKRVQAHLQAKYRTKSELIIESVRTSRYFAD